MQDFCNLNHWWWKREQIINYVSYTRDPQVKELNTSSEMPGSVVRTKSTSKLSFINTCTASSGSKFEIERHTSLMPTVTDKTIVFTFLISWFLYRVTDKTIVFTFLISWFLYRTTLVPFGASPYLCTSADIEVTPLTEKSKGGIGYLKWEENLNLRKSQSKKMREQLTVWYFIPCTKIYKAHNRQM